MDTIKFGTGGWRAIIGNDFICANVRRVAEGIFKLMEEENKTDKPVIIGYDRRFLSEAAASSRCIDVSGDHWQPSRRQSLRYLR